MGDPAAVGRAVERGELRGRVDRAGPAVREADTLELGEGREEVGGEALVALGPVLVARVQPAARGVDGVVPAPQHAVVGGEPGVVELVGEVAESLPSGPADRGALVGGERLGDEHVVVDRHGHQPVAAQQGGEDAGREHDVVRRDDRAVGGDLDDVALAPDRGHGRVLVHLHAEVRGRSRQAEREPGRVDQRGRVGGEAAGQEERAVDRGPHLFAVEEAMASRAATRPGGPRPRPTGRRSAPTRRPGRGRARRPRRRRGWPRPAVRGRRTPRASASGRCPRRASATPRRSRRCAPTPPTRRSAPPAARPGGRGRGAWRGRPPRGRGSRRRRR